MNLISHSKYYILFQDQYKFVYDTLEEHIVCGVSWFPVKELSQCLKQKSQRDPTTRLNSYQREYAQICRQTPRFTIGDCAGGHRGDNREKNRDVLVVPRKYPKRNPFPIICTPQCWRRSKRLKTAMKFVEIKYILCHFC